MNFSNLISALNPALGEAYRRERWHSGTLARDTTAGHLGTSQASLRGLMVQSNPEVLLIDLLGGDACLWVVPVAVRSDRRCLRGERSGTAAICRTDPAT